MTETEIAMKAYTAISNSKGIPLMMIGHFPAMKDSIKDDPTMSGIIESTCDRCGTAILSSQIKEQAVVCCLPCMIKEIEKEKPATIKTMNVNGEVSSFKNPLNS